MDLAIRVVPKGAQARGAQAAMAVSTRHRVCRVDFEELPNSPCCGVQMLIPKRRACK